MTLNRSTVHLLISWRTAPPCECKRNIDTGPLPSTNPLCQYSASLHNADGFRVGLMVTSRWCQQPVTRDEMIPTDWKHRGWPLTGRTVQTDIAMYTVSQNDPPLLWPFCAADAGIIFLSCFFFLFSSPNLSGRRLDVCHTCTHGVALVRI